MKGLLIKDFRLMLSQKRFFGVVIGMGVLLMFTSGEPSTALGYITMLLTIFTLSTISYDEHENGMNFLLTLPVSRKTYIQEKYVFAGLLAVISGALSIFVASVVAVIRNLELDIIVLLVAGGIMVGVAVLCMAVTLPLQIKFGAEKGRMAMFIGFAVAGIMAALVFKLAEQLDASLEGIIAILYSLPPAVLVLLAVFALILALLASYFTSVRIINKKEY